MNRFAERRRAFLDALPDDAMAVIPAARETTRNDDVQYPFRQDSDFFLLTGFPEPDAVAVFDPAGDERFVLFVRPRDREAEAWTGYRVGVEGARDRYGADAAFPLADLDRELRRRILGKRELWYRSGDVEHDRRVAALLAAARGHRTRHGATVPDRIVDPRSVLEDLRIVKTPAELDALRRACEISAAAHAEAMRYARPGMSEREVQAAVQFVCRAMGSERDGYPPIVASGVNATILHYTENDRLMEAGDLLLVDAGAEYRYLTADITRTFPVSGRFTPEQRAVYEVVLVAQERVLARIRPGIRFDELHRSAVRTLTEGMVELGLLPGPVDDAVGFGWYREWFFHGTGHWLGMDVHDTGAYRVDGKGRTLVPDMVFTVEPGIYVAPDREEIELAAVPYDEDELREVAYLHGGAAAKRRREERLTEAPKVRHRVPDGLRGVGVRIEDDIVVTASGHENLTRGVPVDPAAVEDLCRETPKVPRLAEPGSHRD